MRNGENEGKGEKENREAESSNRGAHGLTLMNRRVLNSLFNRDRMAFNRISNILPLPPLT